MSTHECLIIPCLCTVGHEIHIPQGGCRRAYVGFIARKRCRYGVLAEFQYFLRNDNEPGCFYWYVGKGNERELFQAQILSEVYGASWVECELLIVEDVGNAGERSVLGVGIWGILEEG